MTIKHEVGAKSEEEQPPRYIVDQDCYSFEDDSWPRSESGEIFDILMSRKSSPSKYSLLNIYYFQLRGAFTIVGDSDDEANEILTEVNLELLQTAARLTFVHLRTGSPLVPKWVKILNDAITSMVTVSFPTLSHVDVEIDQVARLQMRAFGKDRVRISSFTREIYFQFNMYLWNYVFAHPESETKSEFDESLLGALRLMLPYFIFMNDVVPISRLPQCGAREEKVHSFAYRGTHVQMLFLLAHEYGHLFHHHNLSRPNNTLEALEREFEADEFALKILTLNLEGDDNPVYFPSYRWIFQLQQLDEIVGSMLRGQVREIESLSFDKRKNNLYKLLPLTRINPMINFFEARGTVLLMSLKRLIYKLGSEKIRAIADEVSQDLFEHKPIAWWEDIKVYDDV